jgi:peptide subunit release factor 1 (eRF1)
MPKTSPALATPLREQLEKLAAFEAQDLPVLSLYLNLAADQHGRDRYDAFIRKAFADRQKAFKDNTPARSSFDRDVQRIQEYLVDGINRATNGLALFACHGANEFFEAVQLQVPVDEHWLFVGSVPHLYPLAKLADQYPRYAAVVLDTHQARIVVFGLGEVERKEEVTNVKTRRNSMGGWSQARYQRRAENFHLLHVKEVVETLDKIAAAENIPHIVIVGDEVVVPIVKEQMPQRLMEKLVDIVRMEKDVPEDELLRNTLEALRQKDAENDVECVEEVIGAWQANGLGTVGPDAALSALQLGQVDELLITGTPDQLKPVQNIQEPIVGDVVADTSAPSGPGETDKLKLASELVTRAEQTGARVRFIEDPQLLANFGGVAARLRFRV